jgi:uncharacterized protein YggE
MKTRILIIGLVLAVLLSACAPTNEKNPRTVSVTGTGLVTMTPDIAYVNLGVHTEGATAAVAVAENNARSQKVIDSLTAAGVAAEDIKTTNFSIYPSQQMDPATGKPLETTYMVDNTVYVTIRDLEKVGEILDGAVKAGSNSINSISFDKNDKTEDLSKARAAAVQNAGKQAEELAKAAGVELGAVQTITTYDNTPIPYAYDRAALQAAPASVPISPGTLQLTVTVSMVYFIK